MYPPIKAGLPSPHLPFWGLCLSDWEGVAAVLAVVMVEVVAFADMPCGSGSVPAEVAPCNLSPPEAVRGTLTAELHRATLDARRLVGVLVRYDVIRHYLTRLPHSTVRPT